MLSLSSISGAPGMWAALLLLSQLAGRPGPGIDRLPHATVLVDSGSHELVIELPPVDVPAASHGGEAMVGLPLCQVLVPLNASLHGSRVEVWTDRGACCPTRCCITSTSA